MDNLLAISPLKVFLIEVLFFASVLLLGVPLQKLIYFLRVLYVTLSRRPAAVPRVLKAAVPADEEWENVVGDLLEEHREFPSRAAANTWLRRQLLMSLPHLLLKAFKGRLASYLGRQVR